MNKMVQNKFLIRNFLFPKVNGYNNQCKGNVISFYVRNIVYNISLYKFFNIKLHL